MEQGGFLKEQIWIPHGFQSRIRKAEVRELMALNHIPYSIRVINRKSPAPFGAGSRARTGTFGENLQLEYEYTIFVRRADYEKANAIMNGKIK